METNEELNRWAHSFLGKKMPEPEVCPLCNVSHDSHKARFNNEVKALPDYCSSLDLAAKVEAKAIEMVGRDVYVEALERVITHVIMGMAGEEPVKRLRPIEMAGVIDVAKLHTPTAPAITRVEAAKRAVEGKNEVLAKKEN